MRAKKRAVEENDTIESAPYCLTLLTSFDHLASSCSEAGTMAGTTSLQTTRTSHDLTTLSNNIAA